MARLVVVEGPDKVGKETQSKRLARYLEMCGRRVRRIEVPVHDGITYRLIYWMLRNGLAVRWPNAFQFVQFLNKWLFQVVALPWLRWKHDYVIFDRWAASAVVYGDATGVSPGFNRWLYRRLKRPDLTVVLMGPSFDADREDDAYEKSRSLQRLVRVGYRTWVEEDERSELLDANLPRETVLRNILNVLRVRFGRL